LNILYRFKKNINKISVPSIYLMIEIANLN